MPLFFLVSFLTFFFTLPRFFLLLADARVNARGFIGKEQEPQRGRLSLVWGGSLIEGENRLPLSFVSPRHLFPAPAEFPSAFPSTSSGAQTIPLLLDFFSIRSPAWPSHQAISRTSSTQWSRGGTQVILLFAGRKWQINRRLGNLIYPLQIFSIPEFLSFISLSWIFFPAVFKFLLSMKVLQMFQWDLW